MAYRKWVDVSDEWRGSITDRCGGGYNGTPWTAVVDEVPPEHMVAIGEFLRDNNITGYAQVNRWIYVFINDDEALEFFLKFG